MIAFGVAITDPEIYERFGAPGIRWAAEPNSEVLAFEGTESLFRTYNLILDQAAALDGLEALVLLHQDSEIVDPDFCGKLREALREPDVAIVGSIGALGVRNMAYWEGSVTWASFAQRYEELGGGELQGVSWDRNTMPDYAHTGEVDSIDGFMFAMSPWAVRELRFDEALGPFHGYDLDICLQARAAGRKVVTADLRVIHHHSLEFLRDAEGWIQAHIKIAEKWDGQLAGVGEAAGDWKQRARRAEAEASAARLQARALEARGRAVEAMTIKSTSWRLTKPARRLGSLFRRRRR